MINDFLENYVGFTAKQSVLDEIHKSLLQERAKVLGYENKVIPIATVRIEDPKSKEILSIGASIPNDLITDNWGELLAAIHGPFTTARTFSGLNDVGNGGPFTIRVWRAASGNSWDRNFRTQIQVGSGSSPVARTDFNIETAFGSGIESTRVPSNSGGYNATLGQVKVSANISPTTGGGTVTESCMFWDITDDASILRTYLMSHDLIAPGVVFLAGQSIVPEYTYQL